MTQLIIALLCFGLIWCVGCQSASAIKDPGSTMTLDEFKQLVDMRSQVEAADFAKERIRLELNSYIRKTCQARALTPEVCEINPNTRQVTRRSNAPPIVAAAKPSPPPEPAKK